MIELFWIALTLIILYLLALRGRTGHPGLEKLRGSGDRQLDTCQIQPLLFVM